MDLRSLQEATGLEGAATELSVWELNPGPAGPRLADPRLRSPAIEQAADTARRLGATAQRWTEISSSYAAMTSFMDLYMTIIYVIFAAVAAVGMTNSVLLSVQGRVRDIGTLRVVALSARGVSLMITAESLFLGLLGAAIGLALGGTVAAVLERTGFALPMKLESVASYLANGLRPRFSAARAGLIAGAAALVPVLACLLPITAIRRITVREALGSL